MFHLTTGSFLPTVTELGKRSGVVGLGELGRLPGAERAGEPRVRFNTQPEVSLPWKAEGFSQKQNLYTQTLGLRLEAAVDSSRGTFHFPKEGVLLVALVYILGGLPCPFFPPRRSQFILGPQTARF